MEAYSAASYAALASDHIESAQFGWRGGRIAPKVHAMAFGLVEDMGMSIIDMDRVQLKALALKKAKEIKFGFIGFFITDFILSWVVGKLVDLVVNWLIARFQAWIDRNKVTTSTWDAEARAGVQGRVRAAVMNELQPMFKAARGVLAA